MKIKNNNIEFIAFTDGVCDILSDGDTIKYESLAFSNCVLGVKRYFAAASNNNDVIKVVRIPCAPDIDTYNKVGIKNTGKFDIILIQEKYDTNPPCFELTLKLNGEQYGN